MKFAALAFSLLMIMTNSHAIDADGERLRKFNLALETLKIAPETTPSYDAFPLSNTVNLSEVMSISKAIDPDGALRRYLSLDPSQLSFYTDFFHPNLSSSLLDYELSLSTEPNQDSEELIERLQKIALNVKNGLDFPLAGFKVVIDPGHMGHPSWDNVDGKFVTYKGKTVREGELNLWTAMLLANELEKLGAEVKLTRTTTSQVTPYTLANFNALSQTQIYFYKSFDSWMVKYLTLSDAQLVSRIRRAPEVAKAYTAASRENFFLQEDLNARMNIVDDNKPDLFIGIHYDSEKTNALQNRVDDSEVYVPGAIGLTETGSRKSRAHGLKHLLDVRRWNQSVKLAEKTVNQVSKNLHLPLMNSLRIPSTIKVKDGVFARNLFQTNRADKSLCVFFESLHYDHVNEFPRLSVRNAKSVYQGKDFIYPARLNDVAGGIRDGILSYFNEFTAD